MVSLIITVTLNIIMGSFLAGEGLKDSYINSYLTLNKQHQKNTVPTFYNDTMENGDLSVSFIEYGRNKDADLASKTTNLTPYIGNYQGLTRIIRGLYWDYEIDQVPLAGKIWYPTQGDNYPVLFIIHGNHTMTTKSYLGYDYLGEYLASYGYVVISVDEAFCNAYIDFGLSNENDARAILLLENMKQIESYNKDLHSILYQKMDFENIALAGHSRGGESVATAALFNNYKYNPDNGNFNWDYNYNIKSIIAIAPTCDQYQPAKHEVQLNNMNYLLLQGSNDQDVTTFMGYRQYYNMTFSEHDDAFKAYVYIAGANHGQFNTSWGRYDLPSPIKPFLNTRNLLEAKEQRSILKTYTKVFLDVTLKKDNRYKNIFTDNNSYLVDLPKTLYIQNYQDSSFNLVCDFEEDSDISQGITEHILLEAQNMSIWKEDKNSVAQTWNDYGLHLEWKDTNDADYSITLPEYNASNGYLQFDIMDINQKALSEDNIHLFDATIELVDSKGNRSSLCISDYFDLYPPLPVKLFKLQFLTGTSDYRQCFQTVQLSTEDFESKNIYFDSSSIVKIIFRFDKYESGKIMIDNIGFGR
jgi:dienelactone hydrolase